MLKYLNTDIVFQEVPDETSLAINITGCPCRCPGCHSPYLWADTGMVLDTDAIDSLMAEHGEGITCVCFMGGDAAPHEVEDLAAYIHQRYPQHKVAWYSGRQYIPHAIDKRSTTSKSAPTLPTLVPSPLSAPTSTCSAASSTAPSPTSPPASVTVNQIW